MRRQRRLTGIFDATSVRRDMLRRMFTSRGVSQGRAAKAAGILTLEKGAFMGRWTLALQITQLSANDMAEVLQKCGVKS